MKRNVIVYLATFLLVLACGIGLTSSYKSWRQYCKETKLLTKVIFLFQELALELNNASVSHPDLLKKTKNYNGSNLFFTDSLKIKSILTSLKNTSVDSVNKKIITELTKKVLPELPWMISSNVTDSILQGNSDSHLTLLVSIDSLLKIGKKRVKFLSAYKTSKMESSFNKVASLLTLFIEVYLAILIAVFWRFRVEKLKRKKGEEDLRQKDVYFQSTLDHMQEGIQIHDFNWTYTYVNNALVNYSTYKREELIGQTLLQKYPGIEQSDLFKILQKSMLERVSQDIETEFVFPNGSKADFELSIQPVPEGIFILSIDRTERNKIKQKLIKVNRLYSFLSAINQSIVHTETEQHLLDKVCSIATEIGEFKMAYIGILDEHEKLRIKSLRGDQKGAAQLLNINGLDVNDQAYQHVPTVKVLKTGVYSHHNDMQNDPLLAQWTEKFIEHGINSSISLPIIIFGKVKGVIGIHASLKDFFDTEEISLLKEAAGDISFALENFEKIKRHKAVEDAASKNDRRYRALIEKSNDMKTLTDSTGELIYCSPSVLKTFDYSSEEFVGKKAFLFFHPEDVPSIVISRNKVIDMPGASYTFLSRLLHKNSEWIWCEGTVTNFLHEPAIEAMVTNFRDISEKKQMELHREFDKNNLNALINNTKDLMWSVDRSFRLITSNKPFNVFIEKTMKKTIKRGDSLLNEEFAAESLLNVKSSYMRAFTGEAFSEVLQNGKDGSWSEVSFYPIQRNEQVIGTACFSRDISETRKTALEKEELIKQLIKNNKDLNQFAYITSHNLRGPVANLLGLTSLLDHYDLKDNDLNKILAGIKTSSLLFDGTIRDLSTILTVKGDSSKSLEALEFSETWNKVIALFQPLIEESKAEIIYNFEEAKEVVFYKPYLESTFTNLLTNALKYRAEDRDLKITIKTEYEDHQVVLYFEDNGSGFDSEFQKGKIFQLYQRFHLHKEGKGMGLFLVKSQIEAMGGSIDVYSRPGKGAAFTIRFKKA
ncbi:hypothetical protein CNR22_01185 [Sphingobacteriaceae bacterium]|nr:hypothetical protein CNR22_01185 [Sphingobacteriaceae bacterium]